MTHEVFEFVYDMSIDARIDVTNKQSTIDRMKPNDALATVGLSNLSSEKGADSRLFGVKTETGI